MKSGYISYVMLRSPDASRTTKHLGRSIPHHPRFFASLRMTPHTSAKRVCVKSGYISYYSERFIGDTGVTFPSYEANSDGNKVSPIKRSH